MGDYDRSSKWLIQHHGDALLHLAGIDAISRWAPLQAEVVQPLQLPDGCLEVQLVGADAPIYLVLELATYPERRVTEQLVRNALLVRLDRGKLPELIVFVLRPKGKVAVTGSFEEASHLNLTGLTLRWKVVELWNLSAEVLLERREPGLAPWATLAHYEGSPESLLKRCREIIDSEARPGERTNLLAVTQVLARLRYNDLDLLSILGGRRVMIESPLIQEIVEEAEARGEARGEIRGEVRGMAGALITVLRTRFGSVPEELEAVLCGISDEKVLDSLLQHASQCRSLTSFRTRIPS